MPKPIIIRKSEDPQEQAVRLLTPLIIPTLALLPQSEFTTRQFVMYLRATEPGEEAYQFAVSGWPDNLTLGRQTIHGHIIPQLLQKVGRAEWLGYVYGDPQEEDGLSVPSRWLRPEA